MKNLIAPLFVMVWGLWGAPAFAGDGKSFVLRPVSGDCVVNVDLSEGSSVTITAPEGNLVGVYKSISSSGSCFDVAAAAFPVARPARPDVGSNSIVGGNIGESGAQGMVSESNSHISESSMAASRDAVSNDVTTMGELADVLLQGLESQLIASAFIGASKGRVEVGGFELPPYFQDLVADVDNKIRNITYQIDKIASSARLSGDSALSERLKSRVSMLTSDRDSLEKKLRAAVSDGDDLRRHMSVVQNQVISVLIIVCAVICAFLLAFLCMRRWHRINSSKNGGSDDWRDAHRADLLAQLRLTRWVPYTTIFLLLVGGFLALFLGLGSNNPRIAEVLTTSLGSCGGLLLVAIGVIKWRSDIAGQLKDW